MKFSRTWKVLLNLLFLIKLLMTSKFRGLILYSIHSVHMRFFSCFIDAFLKKVYLVYSTTQRNFVTKYKLFFMKLMNLYFFTCVQSRIIGYLSLNLDMQSPYNIYFFSGVWDMHYQISVWEGGVHFLEWNVQNSSDLQKLRALAITIWTISMRGRVYLFFN